MELVVLRHLPFEDLDALGPMLADRGFRCRTLDLPAGQLERRACAEAELLVVLGGPIGATDEADHPFLLAELEVIRARLEADRPMLGICLGAQLIARALGATPLPDHVNETGWAPLELTAAGRASPLAALDGAGGPVFHWHADSFTAPPGSTHLARTAACEQQAFSHGRTLALQFHPEVTARQLETWYVGFTRTLADPALPSVAELRADAARHASGLSRRLPAFLDPWLESVGLT